MDEFVFSLEKEPKSQDLATLIQGLTDHAISIVDVPGFTPIGIFARDEQGLIQGGITGKFNWNWLQIDLLWVDPALRAHGLGSQLLERLEIAASEYGCVLAHLDTFSFQASEFYQKRGYIPFATLEDYPPGHQRIYLRKTLSRRSDES